MPTRRTLLQFPFAALLPMSRSSALSAMQQVMGPLPQRPNHPPAIQSLESFDHPSYTRRKIRYEAEPNDFVPAWLLTPKTTSKTKLPAVVCLHQTTRIGKDEPAGLGGKPNLHYAHELAELGFVTIAPDYPNFGEYTFDPYTHGYVSASMKGIVNHMRAVDLLLSLPNVDARRIAACGHSLGGHNSLFVAAFDIRIRCAITSCGFTAFPKYYNGNLTGWSHKGYMPRIADVYGKDPARMPFDFPDVLAAIAPRAVFVNAPTRDSNFEISGVVDCVRATSNLFPRNHLRAVYPEAAHDFPPDIRREAYTFLKQLPV
ncbi:MAG: alpha/beta fold hydrolase [Acidobacteria bacterium]|nr:alpha/beta fold hydrolase [Acidobacteriota bacterium]